MGPEHGCHLGPVQLASGTLYLAPLGRFLQIPGGGNLCEHVSKWLVEEMGLVNRRGHRKEGAEKGGGRHKPSCRAEAGELRANLPQTEREGTTACGIRSWVASS